MRLHRSIPSRALSCGSSPHLRRICSPSVLAALVLLSAQQSLRAQTVFSVEYRNPTIAVPDSCTLTPITEGDLLVPFTPLFKPALGPLLPPCTFITGGPGGLGLPLWPACVGHPPGVPCGVEVDAVSFGTDGPATPGDPPGSFRFSVDRFAIGIPGAAPPAVFTEAPPIAEGAADVFIDLGLPPGPLPPFAVAPANTGFIDGDGLAGPSPFAYPGLGLLEPIPPLCPPPDAGDNVDALDVDGPLGSPFVFFSLDAGFFDPLCGLPYSGSAMLNGFLPGMVLVKPGGGPITVYALPPVLGLDLIGPPGSDDLDALVLFENGAPGYTPSPGPYVGWGGATDMLLFSVRRGSVVIGAPDSIFGVPIEPGDILIPPVAGGVSPFPGIFIAAENLGLATARAGFAPFGDEMDALDVTRVPLFDCNANGLEDAVDIGLGFSADCNLNRIPDECECAPSIYCVPKVNSLGCVPAIGFSGFASVSCPTPFDIRATGVINNKFGLFFYGQSGAAALPFQCGTLCVKPPIRRTAVQNSAGNPPPNDCSGTYSYDFNARIQSGIDPGLVLGASVWGQYWSRDPGFAPPCNTGLTDGITFTICP